MLIECLFTLSRSIRTLFCRGADPNYMDNTGNTPFHSAIAGSNTKNASAIVTAMLHAGADPNLRATPEGLTPVHIAAAWGRPQCLQQLIYHGGDVTLATAYGQTVSELIDDIADETDRSQCKSVLKRTSFTTGSMHSKSKSRLLRTPEVGSLRSVRRKIFDNSQISEHTDSETISHTKLSENSSNYDSQPRSPNTPQKEKDNHNRSFSTSYWNDNGCQTVDHESINPIEKINKANNSSKLVASSPESDTEQANQFSSASIDSMIDSVDLNDNYNSMLYDVTALNASSSCGSFQESNFQKISSKPLSNSFQSSSSSFCSISSIESSDSDNQDPNDRHYHESTNDTDEIADFMTSKLFIKANDHITGRNGRNFTADKDNYHVNTKMNHPCRRIIDDRKEGNEQTSNTIGHDPSKYLDDSNGKDSTTVDREKKLKTFQSPTCSYEVTATPELSDVTWNDSYNSYNSNSDAIITQLEDDLHDADDNWLDFVYDGDSVESESDTVIYDWNEVCSRLSLANTDVESKGKFEEEVQIPTAMLSWSDDKIRQELQSYGEAPGPITTTTRRVYLTYIVKLKRQIPNQIGSKSTISMVNRHLLQWIN